MLRQVIINNAILIAQYTVSGLVPLLLVPHIVHTIGLASYGKLAVAIAWANYGCVVVQYALQLTGPKRIAQLSKNEPVVEVFAQFTAAKFILLAGVLPVIALFALSTLPTESAATYAIVLILLPLATALNSGWYLQATGRFAWVCTLAIIGATTSLSIGFIFVVDTSQSSIIATAITLSFGPLLTGLLTFIVSKNSLNGCISALRSANPRKVLRDGWPLFISQFTATIYTASGPILINWLSDSTASGAYSTVERISNAIIGAFLLTHTAAYPRLAALYLKKRMAYWRLLQFVLLTYLACGIGITAIAWLYHDQLSIFLFGESKIKHDTLINWSLLWIIFGVFGTALTGYLTVSGRQDKVMPLNIKILLTAASLGIPGTLAFGAWAWIAALCLSQLWIIFSAYKYWSIERNILLANQAI